MIPLHESTVAEPGNPFAGDLGNLVAGPPAGAIHESYAAGVARFHLDHGWVWAVERDELPVGNEQSKGRGIFDDKRRITIVGADAQEVPIADAAFGFDEFVTHVV